MIPTFLLLGIGERRRFWIPLPLFLLWPFWLLGWLVWMPARLIRARWEPALRTGLMVGAHLGGLRIDVDASDGTRIHLRFV